MAKARSSKPFPFEESLARLEALVESMESGELSLEESLTAFEEGVRLTRQCQSALEQAGQAVQQLLETADGFRLEPLDTPGDA